VIPARGGGFGGHGGLAIALIVADSGRIDRQGTNAAKLRVQPCVKPGSAE